MKKIILLVVLVALGFYVGWPAYSGYQIHSALQSGDRTTLASKIDFPSVRKSMRTPVLAKVDERMGGIMKSLGPAASALGGKQVPKQKIESVVDGALADVVQPDRIIAIYGKGGDYAGAMQDAVIKQIDKLGGVESLFGSGSGTAKSGSTIESGGGGFAGIKLPSDVGELLGGAKNIPGIPGAGDLVGKLGLNTGQVAKMLFPQSRNKTSGSSSGKASSFGLGNIKSFSFAGPFAMQLGVAGSSAAKDPDVTAQMEFRDFDWKITKLTPNL